ncbi:MAG: M48 family metallopeptidase [Desulfotomaculaceae bacterium]|nr:M48 family metallopeptidase [Desulfotomaculaceae bacterium]
MQLKLNSIWPILIVTAGVFSLLYLWFTLFPGRVGPEVRNFFDAEQISLGRQYNNIMRLIYIGSFMVQVSFLLWLVFSGRAEALSHRVQQAAGGSYGWSILLFFLILWLLLKLLELPFNFFGSYYWQHQWGFSTQSLGGWWLDYIKGAGLELVLSAMGVSLLFWAVNRLPGIWWLACAGFISAWLVFQTFFWPVVVSPLFNRFTPVEDPAVINMIQNLSAKTGLPVDQAYVMDASRRTTKANAYFTGLGQTKRIVLYDTLLTNYSADEVEAVVAHEMAHWRQGHIVRGLALGILGSFVLWGALFVVLRTTLPFSVRLQPHAWAVILLFTMLACFVASPLQSYFSRSMEVEADRTAVMLTGNVPAAVQLQVNLAAKNLSDVAPAPYIQWFSYSHPPAPKRVEIMEKAIEQ